MIKIIFVSQYHNHIDFILQYDHCIYILLSYRKFSEGYFLLFEHMKIWEDSGIYTEVYVDLIFKIFILR